MCVCIAPPTVCECEWVVSDELLLVFLLRVPSTVYFAFPPPLRAKLYKLQHGSELVFSDMKPPTQDNSPRKLSATKLINTSFHSVHVFSLIRLLCQ